MHERHYSFDFKLTLFNFDDGIWSNHMEWTHFGALSATAGVT